MNFKPAPSLISRRFRRLRTVHWLRHFSRTNTKEGRVWRSRQVQVEEQSQNAFTRWGTCAESAGQITDTTPMADKPGTAFIFADLAKSLNLKLTSKRALSRAQELTMYVNCRHLLQTAPKRSGVGERPCQFTLPISISLMERTNI
jgi:hypothetical protein